LGRPRQDPRAVLNGARWKDPPERYPSYQMVER
jgi:hypothetical protein